MYFKQITVEGMWDACPMSSAAPWPGWPVWSTPRRDVHDYVDIARAKGMKIIHLFETHVHAD